MRNWQIILYLEMNVKQIFNSPVTTHYKLKSSIT
jgi:hypothetical protein